MDDPVARVATVLRDLFGGCHRPQVGVTLDAHPCLRCEGCTRDWTPEARLVLEAAAPDTPMG